MAATGTQAFRLRESFKVNGGIAMVSAGLWGLAVTAHERLLPMLEYSSGVDLVYVPSGVRLILMLAGGVWAAVGVTISSLFLTGSEFRLNSEAESALIAACWGFAPYVSLVVSLRLLGISTSLASLRPWHLPVVSLCAAAGSSVLQNLVFWMLGLETRSVLASDILAMSLGDFLGSMLVVLIIAASLWLYRRRMR